MDMERKPESEDSSLVPESGAEQSLEDLLDQVEKKVGERKNASPEVNAPGTIPHIHNEVVEPKPEKIEGVLVEKPVEIKKVEQLPEKERSLPSDDVISKFLDDINDWMGMNLINRDGFPDGNGKELSPAQVIDAVNKAIQGKGSLNDVPSAAGIREMTSRFLKEHQ